jgi:hypothetical protein
MEIFMDHGYSYAQNDKIFFYKLYKTYNPSSRADEGGVAIPDSRVVLQVGDCYSA